MDCQRGLWSDLFLRKLWRLFGMPDEIADIAIACHTNWTIRSRSTGTTAHIKDKYQSGCPHTLDSNTYVAMGLLGMSYDFTNATGGLFQGDDSCVRAASCRRTALHQDCIKEESSDIGTFCGLIVLGKCLYLDLPRLCAKLMNKAFNDNAQMQEYRTAVRDWLSLNKTLAHQNHGCLAVALAYDISVDDAQRLLGFLWGFAMGDLVSDIRVCGDAYARATIVTKCV